MTESPPLLMGLDVGTTNIKALVLDAQGQILVQTSTTTPTHYPQPGWAYYDPEELWQTAAQSIRAAVAQLDEPARLAGIAIASIGETGVPLDATGQPLYEAITWFDARTEPQVAWLSQHLGAERIFAVTGLAPLPMFSLCKLRWLRDNEPEVLARTALWLNTADYIAYRLCNVPATDYSLASRTLALDLERLVWSQELTEAAGIPPHIFAPLCPSGARLGPVTAEAAALTGLPTSAVVAAGGHDHVVGALAVGVHKPGVLLNSLGTAEALFLPLERPLKDPAVGRQGYTQGAHVAGGYYVLGGQYTSGGSIEWFRKAVAQGADYAALEEAAQAVEPGSLGVLFLPHLRQASPPHVGLDSRGAFIGLSTDVEQGALFRALLEGVAMESRSALAPELAFAGLEHPQKIVAVGGSVRSRLFMQIKAAVYNQDVTVVSVEEATALGAALLAGIGAGVFPNYEAAVAALNLQRTVVAPDPQWAERYETLYQEVYTHLYDALLPLHRRLHALFRNAK